MKWYKLMVEYKWTKKEIHVNNPHLSYSHVIPICRHAAIGGWKNYRSVKRSNIYNFHRL